ncbi:MAG: hypothetical protein Hyperionvirus1_138 [Hyperionvirus sp.]|uniref:Uncharacterized protein n=1 Tax=Hyperionvirus sp. TaxID=2487770 RepID=A0A3G5AB77_9VIRU|nr:MAG: hypothetical protein Hyperionvirus1_138 [Hyperionvirus sp.]
MLRYVRGRWVSMKGVSAVFLRRERERKGRVRISKSVIVFSSFKINVCRFVNFWSDDPFIL